MKLRNVGDFLTIVHYLGDITEGCGVRIPKDVGASLLVTPYLSIFKASSMIRSSPAATTPLIALITGVSHSKYGLSQCVAASTAS